MPVIISDENGEVDKIPKMLLNGNNVQLIVPENQED